MNSAFRFYLEAPGIVDSFTKSHSTILMKVVIDLTFVCSYNTEYEVKVCWLFSARS
jgi:hypothetical protein